MQRLAASYIYPLDGHRPVSNGFVEYEEDGTIIRFGESNDISSELRYYEGAIVPGFVNTHCHIELSYMKGLFRRGSGMTGFIDQINSLRDISPKEKRLIDIKFRMDDLWKQGVSAMGDISNCDDSFEIKASSEMYTRTFLEVFGTEPEECDRIMASVSALTDEAMSLGLDAAPTPHSCYTMSPELLTASSAAALKSSFLSYHSEESVEEEQMIMYGSGPLFTNRKNAGMSTPPVTGKSSLSYFADRIEKIHPSPFYEHILLVHEVCMSQEGIDRVKTMMPNLFIAVCPLSNIFIHNLLPPVPLMRKNGLKITVGTDSLSSNDDLNMVNELFCLQENFPEVGMEELFTWACSNGALFLSMENTLGSISPGKKPGLVFVNHLSPQGRLTTASSSQRIV
jgi:cytosine/adenosine deaminase-related metal-dependent hydrolase